MIWPGDTVYHDYMDRIINVALEMERLGSTEINRQKGAFIPPFFTFLLIPDIPSRPVHGAIRL